MRKAFLRLVAAATLMMWAIVMYLAIDVVRSEGVTTAITLPTLASLPTLEPAANTFAPTQPPPSTPTASPTATQTETIIPTLTPTLSVRVLEIAAVMPGVNVSPTTTPYPLDVTVVPAPPNPYEPLPDATRLPPPYYGWYSFESDHPNVIYATRWERRLHQLASRGQYHRTDDVSSSVRFAFEGEGLRIRYVAARNMGVFQVIVDGVVIDAVDAYATEIAFPGTRVYTLARGQHLLELRSAGAKHPQSEGYTLALDAIQVWRGDANTLIIPPPLDTPSPTHAPKPAARIELVSAPPTLQPIGTPVPPRTISAAVIIAYDENGNRTVDPAEGVAGISVRVVEINTNRVIASGFTDARGYVAFEVVTDTPAQIVVPYFGEVWQLQRGNGGAPAYTLLLTPGNQPGLIP